MLKFVGCSLSKLYLKKNFKIKLAHKMLTFSINLNSILNVILKHGKPWKLTTSCVMNALLKKNAKSLNFSSFLSLWNSGLMPPVQISFFFLWKERFHFCLTRATGSFVKLNFFYFENFFFFETIFKIKTFNVIFTEIFIKQISTITILPQKSQFTILQQKWNFFWTRLPGWHVNADEWIFWVFLFFFSLLFVLAPI